MTPSTGRGSSQSFSYVFSDPDGFADLATMQMLISGSGKSCWLDYERGTNTLFLANDVGKVWQGPVTPGASGTLQNSQCMLDAAGSSVSGTGNNLTVALALTFKPAFAGAKTNFMVVTDRQGQSSGSQERGTWTVP